MRPMSYQMPTSPKDYVPPPRPASPQARARFLRFASLLAIVFVLGGIVYLMRSGFTFWQTAVNVAPMGVIFAVVIIGLSRGMDTVTRWISYLSAGVVIVSIALAYLTGK